MRITKKIGVCTCSMLLTCGFLLPQLGNSIFASSRENKAVNATQSALEQQGLFPSLDKEGNITYIEVDDTSIVDTLELPEKSDNNTTFDLKKTIGDSEPEKIASYDTFEEANAAMLRQAKFRSVGTMAVYTNDQIRSVTNGVVNFNTKGNVITKYTEDVTGTPGYVNGAYGADAAYLGTNSDGTKVKFKMAGVTGWVNKEEVQILNYDTSGVKSVNYYELYNGYIYHNITTNIGVNAYASSVNVGPIQPYMKAGEIYYSYDGHFFYRTYAQMIADYKAGTYAHSINASNPYYNYYQFLSFRTASNYTPAQFDSVVASKNTASKMMNQGSNFISSQNTYGANAGLAFGVAANESAWGMSNYAQQRNNLFGLAAYDSNPDNATSFPSVAECIRQFMQTFVSITYTDPNDVSGLYNGSCLGDKSVGFSIKYASAPYWGETNASNAYTVGMKTGNISDYGKYKIAIKRNHSNVNIRKEPTTASPILYRTGVRTNYPFVILGTVQGESVDGNTTWYKIATDAPLSADRSRVLQFNVNQGGEYNLASNTHNYAYISATLVEKVDAPTGGNDGVENGNQKGDVNGDGIISASDYTLVKKHVLGTGSISGSALNAADYNNDGIISASDYTLIKKSVLGI